MSSYQKEGLFTVESTNHVVAETWIFVPAFLGGILILPLILQTTQLKSPYR